MKKLWLCLVALALLLAALFSFSVLNNARPVAAAPLATPAPESNEALPAGASVETVLSGLNQPIAMAFDPSGRLFFNERSGSVRLIVGGVLQTQPVITLPVAGNSTNEEGLLGLALDPNFSSNHYIYVYYTAVPATSGADTVNKVVRFVENNGVGSNPQQIFQSFNDASAGNHNGGNIHFGPDGKLYISIGDDGDTPQTAQDVTKTNGKMHRINPDGSIPADNPVFTQTGALGSLYAMGLRNSFDFAFDPLNGSIWASENGPSCDDEINHILPDHNYGWRPSYPCDDGDPSVTYNTLPPDWWRPASQCCIAPTGVEFYSGSQIPAWNGGLFMCDYGSGGGGAALRHFYLNADHTHITSVGVVQGVTCSLDLQTGPDGALYYLEGGGYSDGTLKKIVGNGPTFTPTATATRTATQTATHTATATATRTATATGTPPTPAPCSINFSDVANSDYYYEPVRYLYCAGVISGYDDNTFRPGNTITRGQLVKVVVLAKGWSINTTGGPHFTDEPATDTFYNFVETAYNHMVNGQRVINGYDDHTFRAYNAITRGQITKVVAVAEGWPLASPSTPTFNDVAHDNPFYSFIETAVDHGVISGYSDHSFRWGPDATRAQISKIIYLAVTGN